MSPRALLLSPDDQAVNAITGVLQEMSVTCERPLDGASAAKKLNSQTYDLVLVDCDNLPAAKLILDVCRRAPGGISIPIAIVDGRAGLPTAFRLGAELILTKPVAKDQARSTFRTAVSRLRKEEPARAAKPEACVVQTPAQEAAPVAEPAPEPAVAPPAKALAAAAGLGATSSMLTSAAAPAIAEPAPPLLTSAAATPTIAEPAPPVEPLGPSPTPAVAISAPVTQVEPAVRENAPAKEAPAIKEPPASSTTASPFEASDDLVMAELVREESEPSAPVFSSYRETQDRGKGRGRFLALLSVGVLAGGFYAAWMLEPQFREIVQAEIGKAKALVGAAIHEGIAVRPARAPQQPVKSPMMEQVPAPTKTANPVQVSQPASVNQAAAPGTAVPSAAESSTPLSNSQATSAAVAGPVQQPLPATATAQSSTNNSAAQVSEKNRANPAQAEMPWEKDTLILSSKGAEKRLIRRVQPVFPAAAAQKLEGTVVLKVLVGADGAVQAVRVVDGNPAVLDPVMAAVKQWRYRPYAREGKLIRFQTIAIIDFQ